jgi:predicted RNA binding protein YcfA (HicA-like mRNA interferase family)
MPRFPVDAPREKVFNALVALGFRLVREGNHLSLERENEDESRTPVTLPDHRTLRGSTLRIIVTQSGIPRDDFMTAYDKA